jgi:hypothetical protein
VAGCQKTEASDRSPLDTLKYRPCVLDWMQASLKVAFPRGNWRLCRTVLGKRDGLIVDQVSPRHYQVSDLGGLALCR